LTQTGGELTGQKSDVKFCVCALLDLLGFSSHLEISAHDLRTAIGEHATMRLENLEAAAQIVRKEQTEAQEHYPDGLHLQRINDAIVIAMDLDDILRPSVGQTAFHGMTPATLIEFSPDGAQEDAALTAVETRLQQAVDSLARFVGLVARLHLFIQKREGGQFFPGAKTVVATGFRKPFAVSGKSDDVLSANFAFANAFVAEKGLHGPHFFADNGVLEILARNVAAFNLVRLAHYHWQEKPFDPLAGEFKEGVYFDKAEAPSPIEVTLFRRRYWFRRLNASPLSFVQHVPSLAPYLKGTLIENRSNLYYAHVFDAMRHGIGTKRIASSQPPRSFVYNGTNDLSVDVRVFPEFISKGESTVQAVKKRAKHLSDIGLEHLDEGSELASKLRELDEQVVELQIERLKVADLGDALWTLGEEDFTGLLPLLEVDASALAYRADIE
jgi:hypothetical protein